MCDLPTPRYLLLHHHQDLSQDTVGLDLHLENVVPDGYRVVSVTRDKIITDTVVIVYEILLEKL